MIENADSLLLSERSKCNTMLLDGHFTTYAIVDAITHRALRIIQRFCWKLVSSY